MLFSAITIPTTPLRFEPRPVVTADAERRYEPTDAATSAANRAFIVRGARCGHARLEYVGL